MTSKVVHLTQRTAFRMGASLCVQSSNRSQAPSVAFESCVSLSIPRFLIYFATSLKEMSSFDRLAMKLLLLVAPVALLPKVYDASVPNSGILA